MLEKRRRSSSISSPPAIVSRAGEIFGAKPEPADMRRWMTLGEAIKEYRDRGIESRPFAWGQRNGRLVASVEGRPKSKCLRCGQEVYRGVLSSGRQALVTKQGLWHEHG